LTPRSDAKGSWWISAIWGRVHRRQRYLAYLGLAPSGFIPAVSDLLVPIYSSCDARLARMALKEPLSDKKWMTQTRFLTDSPLYMKYGGSTYMRSEVHTAASHRNHPVRHRPGKIPVMRRQTLRNVILDFSGYPRFVCENHDAAFRSVFSPRKRVNSCRKAKWRQ